jgi:hypothetical protein
VHGSDNAGNASVIGDAKNAHIINRTPVVNPKRSACICVSPNLTGTCFYNSIEIASKLVEDLPMPVSELAHVRKDTITFM